MKKLFGLIILTQDEKNDIDNASRELQNKVDDLTIAIADKDQIISKLTAVKEKYDRLTDRDERGRFIKREK